MASDLPEVPDAPNVFLEALQDEESASMRQNELNRRRMNGCTITSRLQGRVEEGSCPAMHEERLRVRSTAASTGLGADIEESAYATGVHAVSRKTLPTKSAGKRRASAEHALSDREKRQSRCPDRSEPLYASEEDADFEEHAHVSSGSLLAPTPSSALKSGGKKAKQYPIAILLPIENGRDIVLRNGIPAELATFLRGEVDKWLDNALRIKWWNSIYYEEYADCMLTQAVCIIGVDYSSTLEGQHATRACRLCVDPSISGLCAPRPCVELRKDAKGKLYMLFVPLMPYMREGKSWLERGFWMNESKHPYIPRPYPEDAY